MLYAPPPTEIVWTETVPACSISVYYAGQSDIRTATAWLEREFDLGSIREFGENWDGFGSAAPDPAVLDKASLFLHVLRNRDVDNPPMRIVLSPSGSIAFEWSEGSNFLSVEIGDSNEVEWMLANPGEPTKFRTETLVPEASEMVESQAWKSAPVPAGEHDYASAL